MTGERGQQVIGVIVTSLVLTWIMILLRCYVRKQIVKSFGLDDWLAVVALIVFSVNCGLIFWAVHSGSGRRASNLSQYQISIVVKGYFFIEITFVVATAVIKMSVSALLFRIAMKRSHIWILYINIAVVIIFSLICFFIYTFLCNPISYFWTRYDPAQRTKGSCLPVTAVVNVIYVGSAISFVSDILLAALPSFIIWKSHMRRRDKTSIMVILALGSLAGASSLVRIPYAQDVRDNKDITFATADLTIWGCIEPALGIITASAATLRPLFHKSLFKGRLSSPSTKPSHQPSEGIRSRKGYFRNPSDTHVMHNLGFGNNIEIPEGSIRDGVDSGRDGSTSGLVFGEVTYGDNGSDLSRDERTMGVGQDRGIVKTTVYSVHRDVKMSVEEV